MQKNKFELIWSYILKVMIFTIFMNFLEFFWIYLNVFSILKLLNTTKKRAKRGYFIVQDPREGDVAHKATWQSREDPCGRLRGTEVTRMRDI